MINGSVKFFNDAKGFGFLRPDDGSNDAFVHITALERSGIRTLSPDQKVTYELEQDRTGKMSATNVQLA